MDALQSAINNTVRELSSKGKFSDGLFFIGMKANVREALECFLIAMFPNYVGQDFPMCQGCSNSDFCKTSPEAERRNYALVRGSEKLIDAISRVEDYKTSVSVVTDFINTLPIIADILSTDIEAAYEGDPAAKNKDEIILAYPAFTAISIFRIAHYFYEAGVPTIPRMMTEYGHELTGIDIHPGATVGPYFFIDHGTGVVIGETTTIGSHVKIYQHVTLGAKSFAVNDDGSLVKGIKRHPDIGNNVVIYAGATILGGNVHIGDNCVIGGNVWLTSSIPDNTTVLSSPAELKTKPIV